MYKLIPKTKYLKNTYFIKLKEKVVYTKLNNYQLYTNKNISLKLVQKSSNGYLLTMQFY